MVETCHAAKAESGIAFVHFNGGFQGSRGLRAVAPYIRAVKESVGLLVGVPLRRQKQILPERCGLAGANAREPGGIEQLETEGEVVHAEIDQPVVRAEITFGRRRVFDAVYRACRRYRIPIGLAPNIVVSLVVNPDDAALLAKKTHGMLAYEAWRRMMRVAAAPVFASRMRAKPRVDAFAAN